MNLRTEVDSQKYNSIDLAKFICAILVVMLHVAPFGITEKGSVLGYLNFGIQQYLARLAVPFFFVSSGFFLYRKTTYSNFDLSYTKKYIARALRLYITWSIIYLPINIYDFSKSGDSFVHCLVVYIFDILFVGSYVHLWYLNGLIVAVCITSYLLYKKVNPPTIVCIAAVLYIVGLFGQSWFGLLSPIREYFPSVWDILRQASKMIVTTRDGLFFGFLFVSIGMLFAYYDISIDKRKSLILFFISMLLMRIEFGFLTKHGYIREYDMYLFLVPSSIFLFSFIKQTNLVDNTYYSALRVMSSLVYYIHLWIKWIIDRIVELIDINVHHFHTRFLIVLFITLCISYSIYILSNKERFRSLKRLYS